MSIIAIVNRKGGSGKSTVATHVAALLARRGAPVMLGDVDRQQSSVAWLRRRGEQPPGGAPILGWAVDAQNVRRPPAGVAHVVLDTPGGLHGLELNRLLLYADGVLVPVCDSLFDRESAAACIEELRAHPRLAGGRVRLAVLGVRVDARTHAEQALRDWSGALDVEFIGVLRAAQNYVRCIEQGLTVFDLPASRGQADVTQWQPVGEWLDAVLDTAAEARTTVAPRLVAHPTPRLEAATARVSIETPPLAELPPPRRGAFEGVRRLFGWR